MSGKTDRGLYFTMKGALGKEPCERVLEIILDEHKSRKFARKVTSRLTKSKDICRELSYLAECNGECSVYLADLALHDQIERWESTVKTCKIPEVIRTHLRTAIVTEFRKTFRKFDKQKALKRKVASKMEEGLGKFRLLDQTSPSGIRWLADQFNIPEETN